MGALRQPFVTGNVLDLQALILANVPTVYYICKDSAASGILADHSGNGFNLSPVGAPSLNYSKLVPSDPDGLYLYMPDGVNQFSMVNPLAVPLNGDWTAFCVALPFTYAADANSYFVIGGAGETEAVNYQIDTGLGAPNGNMRVFWEHGLGTDDLANSNINCPVGQTYAHAVVKDGTAKTHTFYKNGMRVAQTTYVNEPTGGTSANMGIGDVATGAHTAGFIIGHVAFYLNKKLSQGTLTDFAKAAGLLGASN
jgi:hypothetical protein